MHIHAEHVAEAVRLEQIAIDICVEKADRRIEGAFAIINQQFAEHLPEQFVYLNREEDMGITGLRQAKLSYHPEILLTYNVVHITKND